MFNKVTATLQTDVTRSGALIEPTAIAIAVCCVPLVRSVFDAGWKEKDSTMRGGSANHKVNTLEGMEQRSNSAKTLTRVYV